jgi:hypothetical protein
MLLRSYGRVLFLGLLMVLCAWLCFRYGPEGAQRVRAYVSPTSAAPATGAAPTPGSRTAAPQVPDLPEEPSGPPPSTTGVYGNVDNGTRDAILREAEARRKAEAKKKAVRR